HGYTRIGGGDMHQRKNIERHGVGTVGLLPQTITLAAVDGGQYAERRGFVAQRGERVCINWLVCTRREWRNARCGEAGDFVEQHGNILMVDTGGSHGVVRSSVCTKNKVRQQ